MRVGVSASLESPSLEITIGGLSSPYRAAAFSAFQVAKAFPVDLLAEPAKAISVPIESAFAPVLLEWLHFLRRTGPDPRIKPESMLRRKMLYSATESSQAKSSPERNFSIRCSNGAVSMPLLRSHCAL